MGRKRKPTILKISEDFTIKSVNQYYDNCLKSLDDERDIVVDLSQVSHIDFAAVQFLFSLKKTCDKKEIIFSLDNISDSVKNKINLCGLHNLLKESDYGSI